MPYPQVILVFSVVILPISVMRSYYILFPLPSFFIEVLLRIHQNNFGNKIHKYQSLAYLCFAQYFPCFKFFRTFSNSLTLCRPLEYLERLVIYIWSRTCQKFKLFYTSGLVCTVYNPHMFKSLNVLFQQCWTEGRSSTAVAEDLRPTATATVAEV